MQNEPEYELIKSSRKTLAAEIKQGRLIIRAPHQAADDDIRRFIQKNRQWIETHLAKSRSREAVAESIPKLTPEEQKFFRALTLHNASFARIANLIKNRDPQLHHAIEEHLAVSKGLVSYFF